jgi:hypothetical protein
MSGQIISRLAFVSKLDVEAILVDTEVLDAKAFRLNADMVEILGENGQVTARGNPGLYAIKLLQGRSGVRIARLTLSSKRTYEVIPKRLAGQA